MASCHVEVVVEEIQEQLKLVLWRGRSTGGVVRLGSMKRNLRKISMMQQVVKLVPRALRLRIWIWTLS